VICNISNRRSRGNHAKPGIEGSEFAQKRLEGSKSCTATSTESGTGSDGTVNMRCSLGCGRRMRRRRRRGCVVRHPNKAIDPAEGFAGLGGKRKPVNSPPLFEWPQIGYKIETSRPRLSSVGYLLRESSRAIPKRTSGTRIYF
jgi:hypothetical protein